MLQSHFYKRIAGFSINEKNNLAINGVDLVELSKLSEYPIYVVNELGIRSSIAEYRVALDKYYPKKSEIFYASKAFLNLGVANIMRQEGIGLDVCSEGELFVAQSASLDPKKIIMHGNNKSVSELTSAVLGRINRIIVDSDDEISLLQKVCDSNNASCSVLLRVNPNINVKTHKYIATGTKESKFGFDISSDLTLSCIEKIQKSSNIKFEGLHFHIGSSICDLSEYSMAIDVISDYVLKLKNLGIIVNDLNVGGGLGIDYVDEDNFPGIDCAVKTICNSVVKLFTDKGLHIPTLMLEPGRSIVGKNGCTLYKIGATKVDQNGVRLVAVNGGMSDNIRPALYKASYTAVIANKISLDGCIETKIVGKCCENGDVLIHKGMLPQSERGDILVVFCTGAYNHSLASSFNKLPIPQIVFVREGEYAVLSKQQDFSEMLRYDLVPDYLKN